MQGELLFRPVCVPYRRHMGYGMIWTDEKGTPEGVPLYCRQSLRFMLLTFLISVIHIVIND